MFSVSQPKQPPRGHPETSQGANGSAKFSRVCRTAEPRARLGTARRRQRFAYTAGTAFRQRLLGSAGGEERPSAGYVRLVIQPFCRRERLKTDRSHATTAFPRPYPEQRACVCLESAAMPTFGL